MSAITIRNLPEPVHDGLRKMAAAGNVSVEALVRNLLGAAARRNDDNAERGRGISEASAPWVVPAPSAQSPADLWGALRGCVQVPPETDLTSPAGEAWAGETWPGEMWKAAR